MATGTVKWFNEQKGYGFIQPEQGGSDVFVHISAVQRAGLAGLNEGQRVSFELEKDKRSGKMAATQLQTALSWQSGCFRRQGVHAQNLRNGSARKAGPIYHFWLSVLVDQPARLQLRGERRAGTRRRCA